MNLAFPRVSLMFTPAVYPRLVLNYDLSYFPYKSWPTQLKISKPRTEHSRGFHEFPNHNLRQIGVHEKWSNIQTNRQTEIASLYIHLQYIPVANVVFILVFPNGSTKAECSGIKSRNKDPLRFHKTKIKFILLTYASFCYCSIFATKDHWLSISQGQC